MSRECYTAYPDEDLFTILKRFAARDVGNLPVVNHDQPDMPIGLVTRSGLWGALETAKEQLAERH
jgi:chloride channel protein, CIC family